MKKKNLGQFFTTNAEKIFGDGLLEDFLDLVPEDGIVVDPFAGNWDLLNLVKGNKKVKGYDLDPRNEQTELRDSILNPPNYSNQHILTNVPFLGKNKTEKNYESKLPFELYQTDDLYKSALLSIIRNDPSSGLIILPLNFFSSTKNPQSRIGFISNFKVLKVRVFEEQVFDDTGYTICVILFQKNEKFDCSNQTINFEFKPKGLIKEINLTLSDNYQIANDFYQMIDVEPIFRVRRAKTEQEINSKIVLRAIDTGSQNGRIGLFLSENKRYLKKTDRTFANIILNKDLTIKQQESLCQKFNEIIEFFREKYNSIFLTNFRESTKSYSRKRIDFKDAYKLIEKILQEDWI